MNKKELIHMAADLILEIQEQGDHASLDINSGTIEIRVMEGKYTSEKDYLVSERFETDRIEGSRRFMRMLDYLSRLASGTDQPVILHYRFYESAKGHKRDVMNIFSFADKVIEDALVKCRFIPDDNPEYVKNTTHEFYYSDAPRIEVEIEILDSNM